MGPALKGKISRVLAAKLSLCCRVDALGDQVEPSLGKEFKEYVENRLATLEEASMRKLTGGVAKPGAQKYEKKAVDTKSGANGYNKDADVVAEPAAKKRKAADAEEEPKKEKKKKKEAAEDDEEAPKKKKKKKAED